MRKEPNPPELPPPGSPPPAVPYNRPREIPAAQVMRPAPAAAAPSASAYNP